MIVDTLMSINFYNQIDIRIVAFNSLINLSDYQLSAIAN